MTPQQLDSTVAYYERLANDEPTEQNKRLAEEFRDYRKVILKKCFNREEKG